MTRRISRLLAAPAVLLLVTSWAALAPADAPDWPEFHGPQRDAKCTETGLLKQWPKDGPRLLWKLEGLGRGLSSVSIADGKLFTMSDRPAGDGDRQFVIAYDLASRRELWSAEVGPPRRQDGPRCTPTIDGDLLYAVGTSGDLVCAETATGKIRWRKSFSADFGGKMMSMWEFSESPLVDGNKLLSTPGAPDATIVALDKKTGELIWKCAAGDVGSAGKDGAGYSSMVVAEIDGLRQYIQIFGRGAIGVEAETGRLLWSYNRIANKTANITTPVVRGNHVFVTTSYKTGSALLKLTRQGDRMNVEEVYFLGPDKFENHHGGVVLVGDHIYGGDGQNKGTPVCLDFLTGEIVWKPEAPAGGSAAVLYADGNLIFRYDKGPVYLIEATPEGYKVNGSFTPELGKGPAWPHPVIHDGKLYLRHGDLLACYDVRGRS
jgi:outer membrane protein assembly factor BamB